MTENEVRNKKNTVRKFERFQNIIIVHKLRAIQFHVKKKLFAEIEFVDH